MDFPQFFQHRPDIRRSPATPVSGRGRAHDDAPDAHGRQAPFSTSGARHVSRFARPRRTSPATRALLVAVAALTSAWLFGLVFFLGAQGTVTVALARRAPSPTDDHNVAAFHLGTEIRASSYFKDLFRQHHPVFLIDGRHRPTELEKWASERGDAKPWVQLRWREARTLARVVLTHAGQYEDENLTLADYTIVCLTAAQEEIRLKVSDNRAKVAHHDLSCADAVGIRLEMAPRAAGDVARLYEVEAIGR